jgi:arsenite methyltransferase
MMDINEQLTPKAIYEMVAELGFRKYFHFGGFQATQELLRRLPIDQSKAVLEVGCASGKTACHLAKTYGCRTLGVDLLPGMITRARERARREGVEDRVEFRVGDAQALPSDDDAFDIVMGEFITGLLPDKPKALSEYCRVAKPGAMIGLNEATWIKTPPPPGLTEYLKNAVGLQGEILSPQGWLALMEASGIQEITVEVHQVKTIKNPKDDFADLLRTLPRLLNMYLRKPMFRKFIRMSLFIPENLLEYFGYGLYTGRNGA